MDRYCNTIETRALVDICLRIFLFGFLPPSNDRDVVWCFLSFMCHSG